MRHFSNDKPRLPLGLLLAAALACGPLPAHGGVKSPPAKARSHGVHVTIDLQNIEVRSAIHMIGLETGLNIITSDAVTGNITLRLHDVPWENALDVILQSKGLAKRRIDNVIWIAPAKEVADAQKELALASQQITDVAPLVMATFHLKYQKAADVVALLGAPQPGRAAGASGVAAAPAKIAFLSARGSVTADARTNTLIINDTREQLDHVQQLLDKIDIPVRQVMIEARIVEASSDFSRDLGARLALGGGVSRGATSVGVGGTLTGAGTNATGGTPSLNDNLIVNMAAAATSPPGQLAVQIFHGVNKMLGLELSALEADGTGKILSNPRLMTTDQNEASIMQGTEIPYTTPGAVGVAPTTSFKNAVLSLKVKPQITPDNKILMDITVNKDSPIVSSLTSGGAPAIDTKQINTKVLVADGDTLVIGGIYTQNDADNVSKVPVLGDLPVLGNAFKSTSKSSQKYELLIFVSPHIVGDNVVF